MTVFRRLVACVCLSSILYLIGSAVIWACLYPVAIDYCELRQELASQSQALADLSLTPAYEHLQALSVRVEVGGGCGTGVLVTRQVGPVTRTYVWTAGHVISGLRQEDGTFRNATIYQEVRKDGKFVEAVRTAAKVIAYSDAMVGDDLAVLEVLKDDFCPLGVSAVFSLDDRPPPVGTELVHVGCTRGLYNSTSRGVISQTDVDLLKIGKIFDQTSCMGYPGSSGGGVYLIDSQCIGLLVRGAGPGLNFIVPARRMAAWAKTMKIEWAIDPSIKVPTCAIREDNLLDDGVLIPGAN